MPSPSNRRILCLVLTVTVIIKSNHSETLTLPRFIHQPPPEIYLNNLRSKWVVEVTFQPNNCKLQFLHRPGIPALMPLQQSQQVMYSSQERLQNVKSIDYIFIKQRESIQSNGKRVGMEISGWHALIAKELFFMLECERIGHLLSSPFQIRKAEMSPFPLQEAGPVRYTMGNVAILSFLLPVIKPWPPRVEIRFNGHHLNITHSVRHRLVIEPTGPSTGRGNLYIHNVQLDDEGSYECMAMNTELQDSEISQPLELRVDVPQKAKPIVLRWQSHPSVINILEQTDLTLSCVYEGSPVPQVHWFQQPKVNNLIKLDDFDSLIIRNATVLNTGTYSCLVDLSMGGQLSTQYEVSVIEKPRLVVTPSVIPLESNSNVWTEQNLYCEMENTISLQNPPFHIDSMVSWYFNGDPIDSIKEGGFTSQTQGTKLKVSGKAEALFGIYQCLQMIRDFHGLRRNVMAMAAVINETHYKTNPAHYGEIHLVVKTMRSYLPAVSVEWTLSKKSLGNAKNYTFLLYYRCRRSPISMWSEWLQINKTIQYPVDFIYESHTFPKAGYEYQFQMNGLPSPLVRTVYFPSLKSAPSDVISLAHLVSQRPEIVSLEQTNTSSLVVIWRFPSGDLGGEEDTSHLRPTHFHLLCYAMKASQLPAEDDDIFLQRPRLFYENHFTIQIGAEKEKMVTFSQLNTNTTYAVLVYAVSKPSPSTISQQSTMFSLISRARFITIQETRLNPRSSDEISPTASSSPLGHSQPDNFKAKTSTSFLYAIYAGLMGLALVSILLIGFVYYRQRRKRSREKELAMCNGVSTPVDSNTIQYEMHSDHPAKYLSTINTSPPLNSNKPNGYPPPTTPVFTPSPYSALPIVQTSFYGAPAPNGLSHSFASTHAGDIYSTLSHYASTGLFSHNTAQVTPVLQGHLLSSTFSAQQTIYPLPSNNYCNDLISYSPTSANYLSSSLTPALSTLNRCFTPVPNSMARRNYLPPLPKIYSPQPQKYEWSCEQTNVDKLDEPTEEGSVYNWISNTSLPPSKGDSQQDDFSVSHSRDLLADTDHETGTLTTSQTVSHAFPMNGTLLKNNRAGCSPSPYFTPPSHAAVLAGVSPLLYSQQGIAALPMIESHQTHPNYISTLPRLYRRSQKLYKPVAVLPC